MLTGAIALAPTTAGGQTSPCAEPYSPVAFTELYPAQDVPPVVPGTDVTQAPDFYVELDTDGDGTYDSSGFGAGSTATIYRSSGDLVLTTTGGTNTGIAGVADIDGDGRTEAWVSVEGGADEGLYLVPGTTPDGTVALVDAGIRLGTDPGVAMLQPGAGDRLLTSRQVAPGTTITDTHDATDVLALGPGGDASTIGPEVSREGEVLALANLGDPVLSLILGTTTSEGTRDIRMVDAAVDIDDPDGEVLLTTDPHPGFSHSEGLFGPLEVVVGSEGTFVRLTQTSRSGAAEYLWSIDDPCTAYAGPPTTTTTTTPTQPAPTAPAARPVTAEAAFTG